MTVKLRSSLLYLDLTASLDTGNSHSIGISPLNLLPKCGIDSFLLNTFSYQTYGMVQSKSIDNLRAHKLAVIEPLIQAAG